MSLPSGANGTTAGRAGWGRGRSRSGGGRRRLARLGSFGDRAVEAAYVRPNPRRSGYPAGSRYPPLRLVAGIEADAEETEPDVVELLPPGQDLSIAARPIVAGRSEEAEDDVSPCSGIERIFRIAAGPLAKPGRGIAGRQIDRALQLPPRGIHEILAMGRNLRCDPGEIKARRRVSCCERRRRRPIGELLHEPIRIDRRERGGRVERGDLRRGSG